MNTIKKFIGLFISFQIERVELTIMCGIIGVASAVKSSSVLGRVVSGLKKLEYRGYDSWGFACFNETGLRVEKKTGRITSSTLDLEMAGNFAIGHTRWATHGGVNDANAHPHTDCSGKLAIAHNGIIENYLELREQLMKEGHAFKSQTDSEVVAHLFEKATGSLLERARQVAPLLKGAFGLVVLSTEFPDELVAIKHESPLVVGIAENQAVIASDPLAFLDITRKVIFLTEGDIVYISKKGGSLKYQFYNYLSGKSVDKQPLEMDWQAESTELGNYSHYMLKEIMEQPKVMARAIDEQAAAKLADLIRGRKVVAIGCGSARHAAVIGKHLLNKIAGFDMDVMMAHEFTYFVDAMDKGAVLLAVSQSGETADVMECIRRAKARGIKIASIVNVPSSTLARESDVVLPTNCGPEISVASTKAFMNQVLSFYQLGFALAGHARTGEILKVAAQIEHSLPYFDLKAREIAQYLQNKQHVYMLGKGVNFPIALEGSLKLKEISYIHAEGMPSGELKHGTLSLIERGTPVVLLAPNDYTHNDSISNGLETKARGAYLIGISDKPHPGFNIWVQLPELDDNQQIFYPLFETIPLQLIAYYTALQLGRDVDKPRNLAKSVTVK